MKKQTILLSLCFLLALLMPTAVLADDGWDSKIPATMPAENITIKAKWSANSYTITFDTDGGTSIPDITQAFGTPVTALADPTKAGYTFAGWNIKIPATMPAENITIKAQWTVDKPTEKYTLTFDTDGGSEIAPITQAFGTAITAPADPTKAGYTFAGWNIKIPATMPAENMTIKAQWTADKPTEKYTLTFDTDGGSEIAPITAEAGTAIAAPADPTKAGYTFASWEPSIPEKMPAKNMTIKAQWTADKPTEKYTVSVTGSYAAPNGEGAYAAGETVSLDAGILTGYDFEGWTVTAGNAKLKDAKQAKTTFVMPDNAVAVTANWKQQKSFVQPQTGDNSRVLLWGATLVGCVAALVCMKKKKK